jgi:hypothetical protein
LCAFMMMITESRDWLSASRQLLPEMQLPTLERRHDISVNSTRQADSPSVA